MPVRRRNTEAFVGKVNQYMLGSGWSKDAGFLMLRSNCDMQKPSLE